MFTRIPINREHIFTVKAEGVLTNADFKKIAVIGDRKQVAEMDAQGLGYIP